MLDPVTKIGTAVEVKTSDRGEWRIGSKVPKPAALPWVFVHLGQENAPTRFFVLTQEQVHNAGIEREREYLLDI